jgi:hypothetical protein
VNNKRFVCFLDLLGFSNYTLTDLKGALVMLDNYQTIFHEKFKDRESSASIHITLNQLFKKNLLTSFEYFIPFSDSIFITSKDIETFINQVSSFLLNCYRLTANEYYNPVNKSDPCLINNGTERWYPIFFRGGLAFGTAFPFNLEGIVASKLAQVNNLAGEAVVRAVRLEKKKDSSNKRIKGPRLLCSEEVKQKIINANHFLDRFDDVYEVLWPQALFIDDNPVATEIQKIDEVFIQASNLFKAYGSRPDEGLHYFEFIKLISRSCLKYFEFRKDKSIAEKRLSILIDKQGLNHIKNDLFS